MINVLHATVVQRIGFKFSMS